MSFHDKLIKNPEAYVNKCFVNATGSLTIRDKNTGEILLQKKNLVVSTGLEYIADRMKDNIQSALTHIAVGTDATPVSASDTALGAEIDRNVATVVNANNNVFEIETDFSETEAIANWKEIGIFNDPTAGVMFNRVNVDFVKTAAQPVNVKFTITFTNS